MSDWLKDVDIRVQFGLNFGKNSGFITSSDTVVVVTGWKKGSGFTNTLRIVYVDPIFVDKSYDVGSDTDSYEDLY